MLSAISSAIAGMRAAESRLQASAARVAGMGGEAAAAPGSTEPAGSAATSISTPSPTWLATSDIDPAGELLDQVEAGTSFALNLKTLETIQAMVKRLYGLAD